MYPAGSDSPSPLKCFVLMPFGADFGFVYHYGITRAINELAGELRVNIDIGRADEALVTRSDKIVEIERRMSTADLLVFDLTDNNPNVLWELGYSMARRKPIIPISRRPDELPFNLKGLDVLRYEFTVDGMDTLARNFRTKLSRIITEALQLRDSLRTDAEISELLEGVESKLELLGRESILKNLARNELRRLKRRVEGLTCGTFELRNERPNKEIIDYFSDYVSQLDSKECGLDTITVESFWYEITDNGMNWQYLEANKSAAEHGARIQRVLLLDALAERRDPRLAPIVERLVENSREDSGRMQFRILQSKNYKADLGVDGNFAILRKGSERLAFAPQYRDDADHLHMTMHKTNFFYWREGLKGGANEDNRKRVVDFENRFKRMNARAEPPTDEWLKSLRSA